ncbi:MAG: NepR family anti-sigma factor [Rhodobacterales bacterium]
MAGRLVPTRIHKMVVAGMGFHMTQDKKAKARIAPSVKRQIDENLKRVYEDALNEDVPDRFKDLLARLRAQETKK